MQLKKAIGNIILKYYFIIFSILMIPAYIYGQSILTEQSTYFLAYNSKFTVNIVILFGLAGYYVSRYTKGMSKWKGWAIWFVVMLVLILFFKYVGRLETRWF